MLARLGESIMTTKHNFRLILDLTLTKLLEDPLSCEIANPEVTVQICDVLKELGLVKSIFIKSSEIGVPGKKAAQPHDHVIFLSKDELGELLER
jgi:hypothetical protein